MGNKVTYKFIVSGNFDSFMSVEFNDVDIEFDITINSDGNYVVSGTILISEWMLTGSPKRPYNYQTMRFFDINVNGGSIYNVLFEPLIIYS